MKATTNVIVGLRNTGDSQADVQYFDGPLKDAILWIMSQLANITMAQRIDLSIGRNQTEVDRGLNNGRVGKAKVTESMNQMLEEMMDKIEWTDGDAAEGDNGAIDSQAATRVEGDTYES